MEMGYLCVFQDDHMPSTSDRVSACGLAKYMATRDGGKCSEHAFPIPILD